MHRSVSISYLTASSSGHGLRFYSTRVVFEDKIEFNHYIYTIKLNTSRSVI
jgi:hypothetical protein